MAAVLAATPAYGGVVTLNFHRSFVAMMGACSQHGISLSTMLTHSGFVSRSRNAAAARVIAQPQFTHLLTIDADMGWPADALPRLLAADKDIIGCTYPARTLQVPPKFVGGIREGERVVNGIARAIYVGCGFTLIKRETLLSMAEFYPERKHKDDTEKLPIWDLFPSGAYFDEHNACITDDVGFCRLATTAGLEVWADISMSLNHTGQMTFEVGPMANFFLPVKKGIDTAFDVV